MVYIGGGREGHLVALQCIRATHPAKRKRDHSELHRLEELCKGELDADPSCMELEQRPDGAVSITDTSAVMVALQF